MLGTLTAIGFYHQYRDEHHPSHEVHVLGRRARQQLDMVHDEGPDTDRGKLAEHRAAELMMDASANRTRLADQRALQLLQNYATAIHYEVYEAGNTASMKLWQFCRDHHCRELYQKCKAEVDTFDDTGYVLTHSECRNISEEDK